jgi:branched-chain amino acid transport system substrate-binding protein
MRIIDTARRAVMLGAAVVIGATVVSSPVMAQQGPGVTDKEIKLGTWMPLTGPIAAYGVPQRAGIEAYLKMMNDRGGLKGRKFELVVEDNAFNPQRTLSAARKLITRDEVLALVVPNGTSQSAATFDYVLGEAKVPLLNPYAGAADWFTPPKANLYGALVLYENQAKALGRWIAKEGQKNVVVVHSALAAFENVAVNVLPGMRSVRQDVKSELFPTKFDTQDYGPIALEIARKKPDAIVYILAQPEIIRITKEFAAQGVKVQQYTYSPSVANSMLELGGTALEGIRSVSYTVPVTSDAPAVKEYRDALAKYFPSEKPDYVSLTSFALTKMIVEAMNRINGPINRDSLTRAMDNLKNYDTGIIPSVSYGTDRHLGATVLQRVVAQGGKWAAVGTPIDSEKDW